MRWNWWLYIVAAMIVVLISIMTCRNNKAYHEDYKQKQREQAMRDSIVMQIAKEVDTVKFDLQLIEEQSGTILNKQSKQKELDSIAIEELRQIKIETLKIGQKYKE